MNETISREDRDLAIFNAYLAGATLADIGVRYNLSRERVRQLLAQQGVRGRKPTEAVRLRHTRLAAEYADAINAEFDRLGHVVGTIKAFVGVVPASVVRQVLEPRTANQKRKRRNYHRHFTDSSVMHAIRRADEAGATTINAYAEWRNSDHGEGMPSIALIIMRYGSWNEARSLAGLIVANPTVKRSRSFSNDDISTSVKRFVAACDATGVTPSGRAYDDWARKVQSAPRLSTIRVRTNMAWLDVVELYGRAA